MVDEVKIIIEAHPLLNEKVQFPQVSNSRLRCLVNQSLGSEHVQVGYGYGKLGLIYADSAQEELGVKLLEKAKEILGPNHLNSLITTNNVALTYLRLRRCAYLLFLAYRPFYIRHPK